MYFLNRTEIDWAAQRHARHPVLGPASRFLVRFRDLIDGVSDGWCHWGPPVRACAKLFDLVEQKQEPTAANLKRALTPVKSFCTRYKLEMPEIEEF